MRKCETRNASLTKAINALEPKHWDQKECPCETSKESISGSTDRMPREPTLMFTVGSFKDVVIFGKDSYFNKEAADAYYHVAPIDVLDGRVHNGGKSSWNLHINGFEFVERPKYDFEDHATFLEGKAYKAARQR